MATSPRRERRAADAFGPREAADGRAARDLPRRAPRATLLRSPAHREEMAQYSRSIDEVSRARRDGDRPGGGLVRDAVRDSAADAARSAALGRKTTQPIPLDDVIARAGALRTARTSPATSSGAAPRAQLPRDERARRRDGSPPAVVCAGRCDAAAVVLRVRIVNAREAGSCAARGGAREEMSCAADHAGVTTRRCRRRAVRAALDDAITLGRSTLGAGQRSRRPGRPRQHGTDCW